MRGTEAKLKQEAMRLRSERSTCPWRDPHLLSRVTGYAVRGWRRRIASLRSSHESRKCARCALRKDRRRGAALAGRDLCKPHLDVLIAHKLHTGASMLSPAPVTPEQGSRANDERVEQHTHLTRFASGFAIPLTLLAQRIGAAAVETGCIHHAQASIAFNAPLVRTKGLRSRDSAASHLAGGQSRDQRSVLVSRARPHLAVHILVRAMGCR